MCIRDRLCIRNAEKKDCEQLAVWWNDGTVMAHAGFPNGLGTSAAEIEKQIADDSDETRRRLIIEYNDVRIGEMSFYVFENHRYEIGIKICESDYQEKGIGRVVLSMLIEELFRMGANVIFLDTNLKNTCLLYTSVMWRFAGNIIKKESCGRKMSKITIYEVQERMPRMETLVELWEASVRATHHFHR